MGGVRISELQEARPLLEEHFDEMEFIVDLAELNATLKLSGAELREIMGAGEHMHEIEEVEGLPGELEKKFDKAGGTISGDLVVKGDGRMKNLHLEEYLETPELKYNRITATGNEFWITDAGVVEEVLVEDVGVYLVKLKSTEGQTTINFEYKDILRGVFYSKDDESNITGFRAAYFEVTGIVSEVEFSCVSLNSVAPERFMTLSRQGNKSDPKRQGSIYLDGLNKCLRVLDNVNSENIEQRNVKVQLGDLSQINHPVFGQLEGYGALLENAYICGRLVQRNPTTGED